MILLLLICVVVGALISYMWVMASYYDFPENRTWVIIEDVSFSAFDANLFNVTIHNLANSASDINISAIRVSSESKDNIFHTSDAQPSFPFLMAKGGKQTFKCEMNWGNLAGEKVLVEPIVENTNASIVSQPHSTPMVKLTLLPDLDASRSIEYFNLIVTNSLASAANLTINKIDVSNLEVNATPTLPHTVSIGKNVTFRCNFNWENLAGQNVTITVKTAEGFEYTYTTSKLSGASLYVKEINFNNTDTSYFDVVVNSLAESTSSATLTRVDLIFSNGTAVTLDTPILNNITGLIEPNQSRTILCRWDWNLYRNEQATINVHTRQGFSVSSKNVTTPPSVIWNLSNITFNLDDLQHFSVNITNMPISQHEINITRIELNQNSTNMNATLVAAGNHAVLDCGFNWTEYVGESVTITAHVTYDANETSISQSWRLPYLKIVDVALLNSTSGDLQINVTISNNRFSKINTTITQMSIETDIGTVLTVNGIGHEIGAGREITVFCTWNWQVYAGQHATVKVVAGDGTVLTETLQISA